MTQEPPALTSVLVVSGGGFQGLGVIKALRVSPRARVIVADCFEDNIGRYFADRFERVPQVADAEAFVSALLALVRAEGVRFVLPATELELRVLSEARRRFAEAGAEAAVPDRTLLELLQDKRSVYARLAEWGLPHLPIVDPRAPDCPFPLIGKPFSGWGGRGVVVLESRRQVERLWSEELERGMVWQPFLADAEELSVDFGLDAAGVGSGFGVRRRVRTSGGFATISHDARFPAAEELCAALVRQMTPLGARGLFNVQLLRSAGSLYVSAVTPRLGTSAVHWAGSGFEPVLHACGLAPAARARRSETARRTVRFLEELVLEETPETRAREGDIEAVVFDLDDTLLPQKRWMAGKLALAHQACRDELPERDTFLAEALRLVEEGPRERMIDVLVERLGLDAGVRERLLHEYRSARPASCELYPDVQATLVGLRRAGYKLGILSDNPPASQRLKLEVSGLEPLVDAVVLTRETGGEKPDRAGFLAMAERLGIRPAALAMVGDNPYRDVAGALAAGYAMAYLIQRPGSFWSFDPALYEGLLRNPQAFRTLDSLRSLTWYLEGSIVSRRSAPGTSPAE